MADQITMIILSFSSAARVLAVYNYTNPLHTHTHTSTLSPPSPSSPEELITNYVRSLVQMVLSDGLAV